MQRVSVYAVPTSALLRLQGSSAARNTKIEIA